MFTSSLKTPKGNIPRASQLAQVRQSWGPGPRVLRGRPPRQQNVALACKDPGNI